ncbi:hypothetical protein KUV65_13040 [Maritalea mobilis]|uniref:hypothetical protein n=1 Tax=Maritalea mobilis TaxID=483324 RepID=UPI001C94E8F9|nr:hypothetical protein [Maritalea mobilis]MBY6202296.1 hypothetical protein [Maritalea mobilis]
MEVILHAGAHRTATATLHHVMRQGRAAMVAKGITVWDPEVTRAGLFQGITGEGGERLTGRMALRVRQAQEKGAALLIVSDPDMIGSLAEVIAETRLYPRVATRLSRIAGGIDPAKVKIALAIRSYDAWWASALAMQIARGGTAPGSDICDRLITQPRRWRHVIADLAHALPGARIAVWSHEAMAGRPDILLRRLTHRRLAFGRRHEHLNAAPGAVSLARLLADAGDDASSLGIVAGRYMPFDPHQRAILRAQYAEDLAWLRAGAGGLADYLDEPALQMRARTDVGRGTPDDPDPRDPRPRDPRHRRLA